MVILPGGGTGNLFDSPNTLGRSKDTSDQKNLFQRYSRKIWRRLSLGLGNIGFPGIKRNLEI